MPPVAPRSGDAIFANIERVNAELFTLTYGAIVRQLLTDLEEVEEVNKQLDQMGYNIGIRLIDEFLAKSNVSRCVDFRETADVIAKVKKDFFRQWESWNPDRVVFNLSFLFTFRTRTQMKYGPVSRVLLLAYENRIAETKLFWFELNIMVGFKMFLGVTASVTNWDAEGTCCSIVLEDNPLVDFVELPDNYQGLYYCNILSGVIRGALDMVSMKAEVTWLRDALRGDDVFELQVKLLKQVPEEYPYKDDE
ncbi:trafficking protein particle complex subunit 3-like protein [Trifolium pratense]|uniref:Trafficking protein particle complex subunit 3-like protein n=3 Tax=Trifolium TaxID=3898 RepID=A0A2K3PQ61_TRIPR|nr:trafficking protein particle complex subunit 3-like protein [Trifolium pratense]